jgi:hypothetical protein
VLQVVTVVLGQVVRRAQQVVRILVMVAVVVQETVVATMVQRVVRVL